MPPITPTLTTEGRQRRCDAGVRVELTNGTKVMATTATAAMAAGLAAVLQGSLRGDLARALGGTCLTLVALTVIALILIRRWIVDTSEERRLLAASQRQAQAERYKYFACQAAMEVEQGRLARDRAIEQRADAARLQVEREAMAAEFENKRADLIVETMRATFQMIYSRKFAPDQTPMGSLIEFPKQHPQQERSRSREHGVVRP